MKRALLSISLGIALGGEGWIIANYKEADVIPIQLPDIRISRTLFVEDTRWQLLKTTDGYVVDDTENPTIILTDCDSDGEQCLRRGDRV